MNLRLLFVSLLVLACAPLMVACGGGGGGGGGSVGAGATLTITTAFVPGGTSGALYNTTQLQVTGAEGPVTWSVLTGVTPPGVDLSTSGVLSGTPTQNGTFDFTVEAADTVTTDTQDLSITISDLNVTVTAGLNFGDAWSEAPVTLNAQGFAGTVSFTSPDNQSGGAFSEVNGQIGTAVWTPGPAGGVSDTLRITDSVSNNTFDLVLEIETNPVVNHTAGFGSFDVWYIETEIKRGNHTYATDMHKALHDVGLWPSGSTGPAANELEELIELLMRVQILRELNQIYLRNADGSQGDGLAISFPFDRPEAPTYTAPPTGQTFDGSSTNYSIMEIADAVGQSSGVLGVAFLDPTNDDHEHDGGNGLGILIDHVTSFFVGQQFNKLLVTNRINANDTEILKALIYGETVPGTRFDDVKDLVEFYARAVALVGAHEIGHSLGLDHNGSSGTLMASSISFGNSSLSAPNNVPLTNGEVSTLNNDLPGEGRTVAPLILFGPPVAKPGGEICVCELAR